MIFTSGLHSINIIDTAIKQIPKINPLILSLRFIDFIAWWFLINRTPYGHPRKNRNSF